MCARVSEARSVNSAQTRTTLVQQVEKQICVGVDCQNEKSLTLHLGASSSPIDSNRYVEFSGTKPSAEADQGSVQGGRNISSIGNAFWISSSWSLLESIKIENKISARGDNGKLLRGRSEYAQTAREMYT